MSLAATCAGNVSLKRGFIDTIMQHAFESVFQRHVGRLKVVLRSYTVQKHTVQQAGGLPEHRADTFHQPTGADNLPSCDRFLRCPRSLTNPASASSSRPASATDSPAEAGTVLAEAVSTAFSAVGNSGQWLCAGFFFGKFFHKKGHPWATFVLRESSLKFNPSSTLHPSDTQSPASQRSSSLSSSP